MEGLRAAPTLEPRRGHPTRTRRAEEHLIPRAQIRKPHNSPLHQHVDREDEDLKSQLLSELRRRVGDLEPGALFPVSMIPEPDVYAPGGDLEKRNRRNTSVPVAPPLPHLTMEGLILPRKPQNPCLESSDHKNLHRELLFNQKIGKNVLNQKSELQKALEKHKESQVKKELEHQKESSKSVLERVIEERARRLETLDKCEEEPNRLNGAPEFLQVHAKLRARMNSK